MASDSPRSDTPPPDPSTLYFACMQCFVIIRSFDAGVAHVSANHGEQRPERYLDVIKVLCEPTRTQHIASCRAESARRNLASAVKAQTKQPKRRIAQEPEPTPTRRRKAPRHTTTNVDDAQAYDYDLPAVPNPTFLLLTRGTRMSFIPPPGVDSFDGLLASIAAAYDVQFPGAEAYDWIGAADVNWRVVIGKMGGGACRTIIITSNEDVKSCMRKEPMEMARSRIRVMELGEFDK